MASQKTYRPSLGSLGRWISMVLVAGIAVAPFLFGGEEELPNDPEFGQEIADQHDGIIRKALGKTGQKHIDFPQALNQSSALLQQYAKAAPAIEEKLTNGDQSIQTFQANAANLILKDEARAAFFSNPDGLIASAIACVDIIQPKDLSSQGYKECELTTGELSGRDDPDAVLGACERITIKFRARAISQADSLEILTRGPNSRSDYSEQEHRVPAKFLLKERVIASDLSFDEDTMHKGPDTLGDINEAIAVYASFLGPEFIENAMFIGEKYVPIEQTLGMFSQCTK